MNTSEYYMHERAMDCCIEILSIKEDNKAYKKVFVKWWNLGYNATPLFLCYDTFNIKTEDLCKWKNVKYEDIIKPRNEPGCI